MPQRLRVRSVGLPGVRIGVWWAATSRQPMGHVRFSGRVTPDTSVFDADGSAIIIHSKPHTYNAEARRRWSRSQRRHQARLELEI